MRIPWISNKNRCKVFAYDLRPSKFNIQKGKLTVYHNTGFTEEKWQMLKADWSAWWNHELDRPMVILENFVPDEKVNRLRQRYTGFGCPAHFPLDAPAEEVIDFFQAHIECTGYYGDAWPKWFMNFGPGIIAGFLGAKVKVKSDTVWFEPPDGFVFEDFEPHFDEQNIWFKRIMQLTETALQKWQDRITVSISDIGENFDILSSFRTTEKLLMDLYDCPQRIETYLQKLTKLWLNVHEKFSSKILPAQGGTSPWAPLWSPGKMYIMQSDFSYMIGPDMFEKFVLPDLVSCCDYLDHSFYHLDGTGQIPHLDILLNIENLHGVQWMPGEGSGNTEDYIDLLKKIIDAGKLSQVYVTPKGAIKIKEQIGKKGFVFHIIHKGMKEKEANELVNKLYK